MTTTTTATIRLASHSEAKNIVAAFCTLTEASQRSGVSESTIRRHARQLGVRRISGRTVKGFILVDGPNSRLPSMVSYSD